MAIALDLATMCLCLVFVVYRKEIIGAVSLLLLVKLVNTLYVFWFKRFQVPDEMCIVLRYMTRGDWDAKLIRVEEDVSLPVFDQLVIA